MESYTYDYWIYDHRFEGTTIIPLGKKTLYVDKPSKDISTIILKSCQKHSPSQLTQIPYLDEELRENLPFLGSRNFRTFLEEVDDMETEKYNHFRRNQNSTLSKMTKEHDMTCVEQVFSLRHILPDWDVYRALGYRTQLPRMHVILAKQFSTYMARLDSNENRGKCILPLDEFSAQYTPVTIWKSA